MFRKVQETKSDEEAGNRRPTGYRSSSSDGFKRKISQTDSRMCIDDLSMLKQFFGEAKQEEARTLVS